MENTTVLMMASVQRTPKRTTAVLLVAVTVEHSDARQLELFEGAAAPVLDAAPAMRRAA